MHPRHHKGDGKNAAVDGGLLIEQIKKAAGGAGPDPAALFFGTVVSASPLRVKVDDRFELGATQLLTFRGAAFEPGDGLILLRDLGGQRFLVLGRC